MAGTPLTRELYDRIVTSYRECPGNFSRCAAEVGVDRRMTTRAWRTGWSRYSWARAVKDVLADESTSAAAHKQRMTEASQDAASDEREKARAASVAARSEEMRMVELARKSVLGALVVALELLPSMRVLSQLVANSIKTGDLGKPGSEERAMTLLTKHATLMDKSAKAADAIVKLSRLDRGQPGAIVGMTGEALHMPGMADDELTYERALEIVESSADILDEVRKAGVLPADLENALTARPTGSE